MSLSEDKRGAAHSVAPDLYGWWMNRIARWRRPKKNKLLWETRPFQSVNQKGFWTARLNSESDWFLMTVLPERCGQPSSPWQKTLSSRSSVILPSAPLSSAIPCFQATVQQGDDRLAESCGSAKNAPAMEVKGRDLIKALTGNVDFFKKKKNGICVAIRQTVSKMQIRVVWEQTVDLIGDANSRLAEFLSVFNNFVANPINRNEAVYNLTQAWSVCSVSKCVSINAKCILLSETSPNVFLSIHLFSACSSLHCFSPRQFNSSLFSARCNR